MLRTLRILVPVLLLPCAALADTVHLTFLHINDVYEYKPVQGRGGFAELETLLERERAHDPDAVFTFGGDLLSPSLASTVTKGRHMVAFLNALGVKVAVLGNHEFDFGPAVLVDRIKESRFPWLGTNVLDGNGKPFGGAIATTTMTVKGVKIGFLGVLTPETARVSDAKGVTFTPPFDAARKAAAALRAQGAEVVVALTHEDLADDRRMALEIPGIDMILGGHDHVPYALDEGGALVVKAGSDADWLAEVDLAVTRDAGKTRVEPAEWRIISTAGLPPSPKLAQLVADTDAKISQSLDRNVGKLATAMDSRATVVRGGEAAIGDLFADALRAKLNTDIAIINGGAIRHGVQYAPGMMLTRRDVRAELPFNNVVVSLQVTGAQLMTALESGVSQIENKAGRFPQVSGMRVSYDPRRPAGSRIVAVTVGGKPLQPAATYSLATIDYLASGHDGYDVLKDAERLVGTADGPMLANAVNDYIAAAGTVAPKVEGRIAPVAR